MQTATFVRIAYVFIRSPYLPNRTSSAHIEYLFEELEQTKTTSAWRLRDPCQERKFVLKVVCAFLWIYCMSFCSLCSGKQREHHSPALLWSSQLEPANVSIFELLLESTNLVTTMVEDASCLHQVTAGSPWLGKSTRQHFTSLEAVFEQM